MLIAWNEDLRTGDDQIDHQHMYLIEQTNRLYELIANGIDQEECQRLAAKLIKYASKHFAAEEQLMEELLYPGYPEHLREHQEFSKRVVDLFERQVQGERITPEALKGLLSEWFTHHIRNYDLALAHFAKKSKVSR